MFRIFLATFFSDKYNSTKLYNNEKIKIIRNFYITNNNKIPMNKYDYLFVSTRIQQTAATPTNLLIAFIDFPRKCGCFF